MAKKVPVTSVTPAIKVKAKSKAQQASTRKMVGAIAAATPAGRVAKAVGTTAKAVKTAKAAKTAKSSRQAGDYAISKESAKTTMGKAGTRDAKYVDGRDTQISKNVSIKNTKSPSGRVHIRGGAAQVFNRELREAALGYSKAEAKANARGLKAANKPTKASKTFVGSNNNLSPSVRRDVIVNQTKPARPNRERGGSLKTLRKQGKTGNK
jgi:hypothetical protein